MPDGFFFIGASIKEWDWAKSELAPAKGQPKAEVRANVANLAKANRLDRFSSLSLIKRFSIMFHLDPDEVEETKSFRTVINMLALSKEEVEYDERFNDIWQKMNGD